MATEATPTPHPKPSPVAQSIAADEKPADADSSGETKIDAEASSLSGRSVESHSLPLYSEHLSVRSVALRTVDSRIDGRANGLNHLVKDNGADT